MDIKICLLVIISVIGINADKTLSGINHDIFFHPDRIVGGTFCTQNEFPSQIDLRFVTSSGKSYHACGGTIVNSQFVLTAAHCSKNNKEKYRLVAGAFNLAEPNGKEQKVNVTDIFVHPKYNSRTVENDIALMKVSPPFSFDNAEIAPVDLPASGFEPSAIATVIGWGALSSGGSSPDILQKVDVPFVTQETCIGAYKDLNPIANSMVCYGEKGKDSCQGDSGGPLHCLDGEKYVQCGIVSWGYGCAEANYPGVYTRVSSFRPWIDEIISKH